ncbi:MAG: hypothetical protein MRJ68_15110 [Nitrospira sp.]|nr:hypothetical protein [Nitrospira sp.]
MSISEMSVPVGEVLETVSRWDETQAVNMMRPIWMSRFGQGWRLRPPMDRWKALRGSGVVIWTARKG